MSSQSPKPIRITKPILLTTVFLATLFVLPQTPLKLLLTKPIRNGPLPPPPQSQSQTTSTTVFSPRSQRELSYLSKPFLQDFLSLSAVSNIFIVDQPRSRYAFCAVAENDVTVHKQIINRLHALRQWDNVETQTEKWRVQNMQPEYVTSKLRDDNFAKYVIVRNPISRTLSAFQHIEVQQNQIPEHRQVKAFHEWVYRQFPGTRSFTAEELHRMDQHWIPQHIHCGMHKARVFKVLKYEQPQDIILFLQRLIPADVLSYGWGPYRSMSFGDMEMAKQREVQQFVRYFNSTDVFDRVRDFCKRDIDMFDYHQDVEEMRRIVLDAQARR